MSTMREHMIEHHTNEADTHAKLARAHAAMSECHKALSEASDSDAIEHYDKISRAHADASTQHAEAGERHVKCAKSLSGDGTAKADAGNGDAKGICVDTVSVEEIQELRASLHKVTEIARSLGDRIAPDGIHGVVPSVPAAGLRPVTRVGQRELVNKTDTPVEFAELLKIE